MASSGSSHLKDIDEKFCQCSICLEQYREPKLLPCLHRYCSDCLKQLIERNQGVAAISCPECRVEVAVPTEGVDGFKTDFYMKNIIEYIQLQKSLEDEKLRDCYGCSKKRNVTSYCYKCDGLLCEECYQFHMTNQSLKEHKQHVLSLEDFKSKHMTLEKLADLKEAPRCQSHQNDLCPLCCKTCNELICVTCVHGIHKNHDVNDVKVIAAEEREKLQNELKNLDQYKTQMRKTPETIKRVKGNINANFRERKETFTTRCERDTQNVTKMIEKIEEDYERSQTEIENNKERELKKTKKQLEEEMEQIKIKYDNMFDEIEKKRRVKLDNLKKEKEGKIQNNKEQLVILEEERKCSIDTFAKKREERIAQLEKNSQQIDGIIGRYENLTATGHSALEITDDWAAVQCIPDICKAIEPLIEDMKREFPELDKLSRIGIGFEIDEDEESPVSIEGVEKDESILDGITGVDDGSIVITGHNLFPNYQSLITVINMNGKVLHQKGRKGTYNDTTRYCAYLSKLKIATVCCRDEIGVFQLRDYSYIKKNIRDVIKNLPVSQYVTCVSTDLVNNYILVGSFNTRDVYVFDDQLNYHHTLTLPEMINYPSGMAFIEGKLFMCDPVNKRAYVVSTEGQEGKITHELTKPDYVRDDWSPLSVCTDSYRYIYILWMTGISYVAGRRVIVQYTQDGSQSLTQKEIDSNDARCIATVKTNFISEKLLVASWKSGKLRIYTMI